MISKTIGGFAWDKTFLDKCADEETSILTKANLNIMSKSIPNEIVTIDDWDPLWINDKMKYLIKNKTECFKNCVKPNNPISIKHFELMQETHRKILTFLSKSIIPNFFGTNKINPKCYWSILKSFLNNKNIPCIPPLIHNNQFVINFKEKSELFTSFFAKQSTHIETESNLATQILRRTNESLNTMKFTEDDTLSVISKLIPNKAYGHNQINIRMLQICDKAICKPLYLIFSSCIESRIFATKWKMANVIPIHKRDDKENVKNYRPVSFLPVFGKILEGLIYNEMYSFFI